jgi:hypothetical protein
LIIHIETVTSGPDKGLQKVKLSDIDDAHELHSQVHEAVIFLNAKELEQGRKPRPQKPDNGTAMNTETPHGLPLLAGKESGIV